MSAKYIKLREHPTHSDCYFSYIYATMDGGAHTQVYVHTYTETQVNYIKA